MPAKDTNIKKSRKSYTSKGQRRSSMKTSGPSTLFITDNRHVTVGWTAADREAHEKRIKSGHYSLPQGDLIE